MQSVLPQIPHLLVFLSISYPGRAEAGRVLLPGGGNGGQAGRRACGRLLLQGEDGRRGGRGGVEEGRLVREE